MRPRVQRVILAWSENDVRNSRPGDQILPLTAGAHIAAHRSKRTGLLDTKNYLRDAQSIEARSTRLLNDLHEALKSSPFPWLEAYANVMFGTKAFQLTTWLQLIRALQQHFLPATLEVTPPEGFSDLNGSEDVFIYRLARESFWLAQTVLQRNGVTFNVRPPSVAWKQSLKRGLIGRAIASTVAKALSPASFPLLCENARSPASPPLQQADVLLVSEQYTDAFHAVPLARELAQRFGHRFLWVGMPPRVEGMTSEESALASAVDLPSLRFLDSGTILNRTRLGRTRSLALDLAGAWRVAEHLAARDDLGVRGRDWFEFLLDGELTGFARRYAKWSRALETIRPKVVVGLSTLQDMGLVRAWTRRSNIPFVCFMHGAFYALKYSHDFDADYIGVFGRILADQLKNSGLPQPRRVVACGAMQFGEKAVAFARRGAERPASMSSNTVLFLGCFDSLPFSPWSPGDQWNMLRDLHQICGEFGKFLRVRPHPRYPATLWSPYVTELERQAPGTIALSSEPSIARDIDAADFVYAAGFNGAALDTLMGGKLLLCHLPEGVEHSEYSRLLEDAGGVTRGIVELRSLFSDIASNSRRASGLRLQQEQFLGSYIEEPESDSWEGALNLVQEALGPDNVPLKEAIVG